LDKAQARLAGAVFVTVPCQEADPEVWPALGQVLRAHKGAVPVFVDLVGEGFKLRSRVGNGATVDASEVLAREIENLVGAGHVTFAIQPNSVQRRHRPPRAAAH
ncbi:MAG: hypothetical protein ACYS8K_06835, partial [Planctomycetota bacterium]